jgi:hypothetical protein
VRPAAAVCCVGAVCCVCVGREPFEHTASPPAFVRWHEALQASAEEASSRLRVVIISNLVMCVSGIVPALAAGLGFLAAAATAWGAVGLWNNIKVG